MKSISLPRLMFATMLLILGGCSSNNKGQIEETKWTSKASAMQLEFGKDHKLILQRGTETHKGTYSLGMGPTVTLTFESDYEGRKIHAEKIVINGNELTMTNPDGTQVTFQKVK